MSQIVATLPEPERLARKLFFMTVAGAFVFFVIVMVMTQYVKPDVDSGAGEVAPLIRLVPAE